MVLLIKAKDTDNVIGLKEDITMRLEGVANIERIDVNADVVEVVRCKDCEHLGASGCAMDAYAFDVVEEGFCSYGERRKQK